MLIDISQHNGNIDFTKVKNQVEGIIIRLGWIGNKKNHTIDTKLDENIQGCIENNIPFGFYVYNYCNSIETLTEGLQWTLEQIESRQVVPQYPIFLDMEDSSIENCDCLTEQCKRFCKGIEEKGYRAGIYANKNWFTRKLRVTELTNFEIWLAQWTSTMSAEFDVDLWQYADNGTIEGINSRVDLNKNIKLEENIKVEVKVNGDDEVMKTYQNGSTKEPVYSDIKGLYKIGYINEWEKCDCYGIFKNMAVVLYSVDGTDNYKIGFCKWLGGVK